MKELIQAYKNYIKFLGDELGKNASFLYTHGIRVPQSVVNEGARMRKEILELENKLSELDGLQYQDFTGMFPKPKIDVVGIDLNKNETQKGKLSC